MPATLDQTPCSECGFDAGSVSPEDAAVAIRSYPRRYRALLAGLDEQDDALLLEAPPDGGLSAAGHAAHVADTFDACAEAIEQITTAEGPTVALDPTNPSIDSVDDALSRLSHAATALALTIEGVHGRTWKRTGMTGANGEITALQVAQHAVHDGHHHLKAIPKVLEAVRGQHNN